MTRKFHAFCLGLPKSGIEMMPRIFSNYIVAYYNSYYINEFIDVIMGADKDAIDKFLLDKDKAKIELDVCTLNGHVVERLVELFPDAKFIVVARNCYSWLHYFTYYCANYDGKENWPLFWDWLLYNDTFGYTEDDKYAAMLKLFPLNCYVDYWRDYYKKILDVVPENRLCLVSYLDINNLSKLSRFTGADNLKKTIDDYTASWHEMANNSAKFANDVNHMCKDMYKRLGLI